MIALLQILLLPLVLLNAFGGTVGFIWLIVIGDWRLALIFVVGGFFGQLFLSIALLPAFGLGVAAGIANRKATRYWAIYFTLISAAVAVGAWCMFVFTYAVYHATAVNYIPLLLFSYGTAVGPLAYLSSKDPENVTGATMTTFSMIGYAAAVILWFLNFEPLQIYGTFGLVMFLSTLFIFFLIKPILDQAALTQSATL